MGVSQLRQVPIASTSMAAPQLGHPSRSTASGLGLVAPAARRKVHCSRTLHADARSPSSIVIEMGALELHVEMVLLTPLLHLERRTTPPTTISLISLHAAC